MTGGLLHPDEALRIILRSVRPLGSEKAPIEDCGGRVLAEEVSASCDLPHFDNSAMDGYAVFSGDVRGAGERAPVLLPLQETVRAGKSARGPLRRAFAVKIMTGAPMPEGADAVVMRECAREGEGGVSLYLAPEPGENVRLRGEDVRKGEVLLEPGSPLRPYEIALLASQGISRVRVVRRPRVKVLVSGDELVDHRRKPSRGQIRNSNGPALCALLARWGALPKAGGIVPDSEQGCRKALFRALDGADALLVSGGVSVGDFDHTRAALASLGLKELFWRIAIKPGKPLLFGLLRGKPVFGLPGNPVSSLVCCEEFVRPAVEKLAGRAHGVPSYHMRGVMANEYPKPAHLRQFVFCAVRREGGRFLLEAIRPQGSAMLGMSSRARGLVRADIGVERLEPGMEVDFRWLK